ncbi:MAG: hypothetical protein A2Y24_06680 [Clostridiales bacterium GWE2_32_10]|nr:MAG: hypothetical protein A2Y24_06680 [Clostridiales bacterium GWE2_32_10]HBY20516.1 helicase [Clostridiales bacterium]
MDITIEEYKKEEEYLGEVMEKINEQVQKREDEYKIKKDELLKIQKYVWDTRNMDSAEEAFFRGQVKAQESFENYLRTTTAALYRMHESAYFGRLDYKDKDEKEVKPYYIGIGNLLDDESLDIYVYDWRTPFASMYYDYETGPASYEAPIGTIEGDIVLKRQYKIEKGKIKYIFDSDVKIEDEILQEVLSQNTNEKMKNIVTTIQKEQNQIIRSEGYDVLVVQGPAGSGKTSVALHRIAYLLYKHNKKVSYSNILIFSPNQVFMDYISNVLPEMGEENVLQTTFNEYAISLLEDEFEMIESLNDQLEYIYNNKNASTPRLDAIRLKMSPEMLDIINDYIEYIGNRVLKMQDIDIERKAEKTLYTGKDEMVTAITKEEMHKLFFEDYENLPIIKRMEKIIDRAVMIYDDGRMTEKKIEELKKRLKKKLVNLSALDMYRSLYKDKKLFKELAKKCGVNTEKIDGICDDTSKKLESKEIYYEDIAPLIYLQGKIQGFYKADTIKHVIIDEAQDYSVIQYEIIKNIFNKAKLTVLGDINQSIHPFVDYKDYDSIKTIFDKDNSTIMKLSKSFRSSSEITRFSRQILNDDTIQEIERYRGKPVLYSVTSENEIVEGIIKNIHEFRAEDMKSIGIICKSSEQADKIYEMLKDRIDVDLIRKDDIKFKHKTVIIPSYLAKGLEFDGVILYNVNKENYIENIDKKLFYTMCTRPLHKLVMYTIGEANVYVKGIDGKYYE